MALRLTDAQAATLLKGRVASVKRPGRRAPAEPGTPESRLLQRQCRDAGLPIPVLEARFHETRKWRFDLCWPGLNVALEIDGGAFTGGRHTRGAGYEKDLEKLNEAAILGYTVVRCLPRHVRAGRAFDLINRLFAARSSRDRS